MEECFYPPERPASKGDMTSSVAQGQACHGQGCLHALSESPWKQPPLLSRMTVRQVVSRAGAARLCAGEADQVPD